MIRQMTASAALSILALSLGLALASPVKADQTDPRLDSLFEQLKGAQSPATARVIGGRIWQIWLQSDSAGANVLMRQGVEAMQIGQLEQALASFDALVQLEPEFSEAWNKRATIRFIMGDLSGSIEDIKRTLALEPRHFGAFSGLGLIYDLLEDPEAALRAYEEVERIHPHSGQATSRIEAIKKELENSKI